MAFIEHPLRRQVVGEMHLRRLPGFEPPARLIQVVRIVAPEDREGERAAVDSMPGLDRPEHRHATGRWSPDVAAMWELHSEASTASLIFCGPAAAPFDWQPFTDPARLQAMAWLDALPGEVVRANHVLLVEDDGQAQDAVAAADFDGDHLVSCHIAGGGRIWADFRIHEDGMGRMVFAANGMASGDIARALQRLQELGNYRNLALLGLAIARDNWTKLDTLDQRLAQIGLALTTDQSRDDDLLADLTGLSAELLSVAGHCDYRLSATAAYAQIVGERLRELDARPIPGFQSLADFTARRFNPAVRTCAAFTARHAQLNDRTAQFTALLRTRIETRIENQNGRLLASMDRSARMQLRLQHLVEGLSVVAISYYALGLLSYPAKAAEKLWHGFSSTLALGLAVPLVVVAAFLLLGRLRRRLISLH